MPILVCTLANTPYPLEPTPTNMALYESMEASTVTIEITPGTTGKFYIGEQPPIGVADAVTSSKYDRWIGVDATFGTVLATTIGQGNDEANDVILYKTFVVASVAGEKVAWTAHQGVCG